MTGTKANVTSNAAVRRGIFTVLLISLLSSFVAPTQLINTLARAGSLKKSIGAGSSSQPPPVGASYGRAALTFEETTVRLIHRSIFWRVPAARLSS